MSTIEVVKRAPFSFDRLTTFRDQNHNASIYILSVISRKLEMTNSMIQILFVSIVCIKEVDFVIMRT